MWNNWGSTADELWRVAPYLGRRSPRGLTPNLERLDIGQKFRLADFTPGEQLTLTGER